MTLATNILALGLNHETASVKLREQAAFARDALQPALRELTAGDAVEEAAILSTCNRTEIYCGGNINGGNGNNHAHAAKPIVEWLRRRTGFKADDLASIYHFPNEQAVKHAFRVACGLDSMVLGEPQILGQMKDAFQVAADAGATGKVLNRLFQHSFSVAKQVRTDTAIGAHSVSVAHAGVKLAKQVFAQLEAQSVLLIGAGETIELAARQLRENGVTRITVANRTLHRARALANALGGEAITLAGMPDHLAYADIVISSTASTLPILGKGAVERALAVRKHKPIFILDLAVPRDVEAQVRKLRDVYLYDIDDLKSVVAHNRGLRMRAAEQAEMIIDLQVVRFMRWLRTLQSAPLIRDWRREWDALGQREVDKAMQKIRAGGDAQEITRQLAHNLINKLAHQPSRALQQADMDGNPDLIAAARKLFDL